MLLLNLNLKFKKLKQSKSKLPIIIDLSKEELERYSRQILLHGKEAQRRLKKSKVLVIGAGGIGSPLLTYLASSGVGSIDFFEDDKVERSNLARQVLYQEEDVGYPKGARALFALQKINPHITCLWFNEKLSSSNIEKLNDYDLILEGSDSITLKFSVSDYCIEKKLFALIGSIGPAQGNIFPIQAKAACYRCVFEKEPQANTLPNCANDGILSPLPAVIGSQMAYLAVQYLIDKNMPEKLYLIEPLQWRTISLSQNPECDFCKKTT